MSNSFSCVLMMPAHCCSPELCAAGVRYNAFLLNSEGKAFIEYLAKHGQLASHHAACMLSKLASARCS